MKYRSVTEIIKANEKAGLFFFDPGAMRFFDSRIESEVIGDNRFITSEQAGDEHPRLYTIREATPDGAVNTVGDFQEWPTLQDAINNA
jgi:hypothetical protein